MVHVRVVGAGHYLPEKRIGNDYFTRDLVYQYLDNTTKVNPRSLTSTGILQTTGIARRRYASDKETAAFMAERAAEMALKNAGIQVSDLQIIVMATESDERFPAGGAKVQSLLGSPATAYDVSAACAGFPVAVEDVIFRLPPGSYGLAVASSRLSRKATSDDINRTLFGDGAGAVLLYRELNDDNLLPLTPELGVRIYRDGAHTDSGIYGIYHRTITTDGGIDLIYETPEGHIRMPNGRAVLHRGVEGMVEATVALKRCLGWGAARIYSPHQANKRMLDKIRKKLGISKEDMVMNVIYYGNMSAVTNALALSEILAGKRVKKGDRVILSSAASGFQISGMALVV